MTKNERAKWDKPNTDKSELVFPSSLQIQLYQNGNR